MYDVVEVKNVEQMQIASLSDKMQHRLRELIPQWPSHLSKSPQPRPKLFTEMLVQVCIVISVLVLTKRRSAGVLESRTHWAGSSETAFADQS